MLQYSICIGSFWKYVFIMWDEFQYIDVCMQYGCTQGCKKETYAWLGHL